MDFGKTKLFRPWKYVSVCTVSKGWSSRVTFTLWHRRTWLSILCEGSAPGEPDWGSSQRKSLSWGLVMGSNHQGYKGKRDPMADEVRWRGKKRTWPKISLCGIWLLAGHPSQPPGPDVAPRLSSYSESLTFRSVPTTLHPLLMHFYFLCLSVSFICMFV